MSLRVVVADDEALVRKSICRFLRGHDVEMIEECGDGRSTLEAIRSKSPNLVFLDMQMPEMTGMSVIKAIGEKQMPAMIIITAHANFAVEAYEFNVVDYILKPFGRERFEKALSRARQRIGAPAGQTEERLPPKGERVEKLLEHLLQQYEYVDRIPVPRHGRVFLVEAKRIEWIEAKGNALLLHCEGETYELRKALSALQKQLDPRIFICIHRSTIVNIRFVREIQPWFNGYHIVVMKSGQQLRMSRYRHEGMERLMGECCDLQ
jgi:two-component system LytT family response regulator